MKSMLPLRSVGCILLVLALVLMIGTCYFVFQDRETDPPEDVPAARLDVPVR